VSGVAFVPAPASFNTNAPAGTETPAAKVAPVTLVVSEIVDTNSILLI